MVRLCKLWLAILAMGILLLGQAQASAPKEEASKASPSSTSRTIETEPVAAASSFWYLYKTTTTKTTTTNSNTHDKTGNDDKDDDGDASHTTRAVMDSEATDLTVEPMMEWLVSFAKRLYQDPVITLMTLVVESILLVVKALFRVLRFLLHGFRMVVALVTNLRGAMASASSTTKAFLGTAMDTTITRARSLSSALHYSMRQLLYFVFFPALGYAAIMMVAGSLCLCAFHYVGKFVLFVVTDAEPDWCMVWKTIGGIMRRIYLPSLYWGINFYLDLYGVYNWSFGTFAMSVVPACWVLIVPGLEKIVKEVVPKLQAKTDQAWKDYTKKSFGTRHLHGIFQYMKEEDQWEHIHTFLMLFATMPGCDEPGSLYELRVFHSMATCAAHAGFIEEETCHAAAALLGPDALRRVPSFPAFEVVHVLPSRRRPQDRVWWEWDLAFWMAQKQRNLQNSAGRHLFDDLMERHHTPFVVVLPTSTPCCTIDS